MPKFVFSLIEKSVFKNKFRFLLLVILGSLLFSGCSAVRNIPADKFLLNRNKIKVIDADVKKEELKPFIRQKPNRRILGLYRFHLQTYQLVNRGRENGIKRWVKNTIGEPPVIFDPTLMESSRRQFAFFMEKKGYFNAVVDTRVDTIGRKTNVTYLVKGNTPYHINNFTYNIQDDYLAEFVLGDSINTLIHRKKQYDADLLEKERERFTQQLRNRGFYNFSKEYIFFQVDSMIGGHKVDIEFLILRPDMLRPGKEDSLHGKRHKRYLIDQVFIYPDFSPFYSGTAPFDTTYYSPTKLEKGPVFTFLHQSPLNIRPRAVVHNILIEPGRFFRSRDVEMTYNYLSGLRNFKFINIQFSENNNPSSGIPSDSLGFLDARIQLVRSPANAFTVEAEGLNSSGNLGVASNFLFTNRNILGGAERLNIRLKGALEITGESAIERVIHRLPFNTLELGGEISIDFPKLLVPIPMEKISKNARPHSIIMTGINYRQRPDYTRYIFNVNYGFEWSENIRKRHYLYPVEISSIKVFNDSILLSRIPEGSPLILSRYKDHLTAGIKYSFVFSSQQLGQDIDFMYFRGNLESAGNLLQLATSIFNFNTNSDGNFTLFNIPFAQYIKGNADWRYYKVFDQKNTLAFRLMAGAGLPYGNSRVMPFVKSFYGGGANSVRAWRIYTLGPGSYRDSLGIRFDRYGDIKLEANIEHRFAIYHFWHGAFFVDAGNVWFINENPQFPGGEFSLDGFYREIAIGAGAGIRFDFDFFVVRVDAAFPVRDPSRNPGERWVNGLPRLKSWNFNLGIGYPF